MIFEWVTRRALAIVSLALVFAWVLPSASAQNTQPQPTAASQYPDLPTEIPEKFTQVTTTFDYEKRDVMIPMRDGTKLHAVIVIPKGAKKAPILMTRTPYNASARLDHAASPSLARVLQSPGVPADVIMEGGYIFVMEDVRGKYGSEGDYVMNRPLRGPLNPTPVDHATDTYDTIDWLVKNVPESNGKVGILGVSYDGFTTLMAMFHPHPALKVVVPMNPMVDGWMGDDWFHYGAFREQMLLYFQLQEAGRAGGPPWWTAYADDYDGFLAAGSAGELGRLHGLEQTGFFRKIVAHPSYDAFWQEQAVDRLLAEQPLTVPVMLVDSLWDQEDIYGATAVYRAIKPKDAHDDKVFLVLGPWYHGQEMAEGGNLGALKFPADTAKEFRSQVLAPFLAQYLKDGAPKADVAPVTAYETGSNKWLRLSSWPSGCASGCAIESKPLYFEPGLKLGFAAPAAGAPYDEYVSDPAKPVTYLVRPVQPFGYGEGSTWSTWLVTDQREAAARPDVLSFVSDKLTAPVKIAGRPVAHLVASTSGTDSDWVVKLIDVYPDEVGPEPKMGGYELMIAADIFRGRYRESFSNPKPIAPDKPLLYEFALPTADHVFLPGHRIMVQIQSSWFPLYDRNPQTFVDNIFWAKPADYKKATQRIYHAPGETSYVELPLVTSSGSVK